MVSLIEKEQIEKINKKLWRLVYEKANLAKRKNSVVISREKYSVTVHEKFQTKIAMSCEYKYHETLRKLYFLKSVYRVGGHSSRVLQIGNRKYF